MMRPSDLVVGDAKVLRAKEHLVLDYRRHHLGVDVLATPPTTCEMSVSVTSQVSCPSTSVAP